jgi:hypothetical protein
MEKSLREKIPRTKFFWFTPKKKGRKGEEEKG